MGTFFKNNDFRTDYKRRPHDEYKAALEKLDEETKRKFDWQRALILTGVLALVVVGIIILAVTGIGTNPAKSAGSILDGAETAKIHCLGDSVTAGVTVSSGEQKICSVTYPKALEQELKNNLQTKVTVTNDSEAEGLAKNASYKQMSDSADIVILQYLYTNCKAGEDPEGILEANIDGLSKQGCLIYLVNYPYVSDAEDASAVKQANQYLAKASKEKSVLLLDAADYFQGLLGQNYTEEDLFSEDGVHLTETGYEELGKFIAGGLLSDAGLN